MSAVRAGFASTLVALCGVAALGIASALAALPLTITSLLQSGWEIAGYVGTGDNRATIILFKKPGETYLVQCATFHDVTRTPRVTTNCYELR